MSTSTFSMRMDTKLKKRLEKFAKSEKRSSSFIIQDILREFLDGKDYEVEMVKKAAASADKGVFISEEAMNRWFDSLGTENELPAPEPDIFPDTDTALRKAS